MYRFKSEELQIIYSNLLRDKPVETSIDTDYQQEIALLMAKINELINTDSEDITEKDLDIWNATIQTIKLKATLIKEQRLEHDRRQKAIDRQKKLNSISLDDYAASMQKVSMLISQYLTIDQLTTFLPQLSQIIDGVENAAENS